MRLNWRWLGFVAVVTTALGIIFGSSVFRKYTLRVGESLNLQPSVSGILQGVLFLIIFIGLCYFATSLYGKPYQLINAKPDKKNIGGRGGGYNRK